jgi:hypothetical protein
MHRLLTGPACAAAGLAVSLAAAAVHAGPVFDNFDDADSSEWITDTNLAPPNNATFTQANGVYRVAGPTPPAGSGTGQVAFAGRLDGTLADFNVSTDIVDFDVTANQYMGVFARATLTPTFDFQTVYVFSVATRSINPAQVGNSALFLQRLINGGNPVNVGTSVYFPGIQPDRDYRLNFQGVGRSMQGSIVDLANPAVPLATFTYTDNSFGYVGEGFVGLATVNNGNTLITQIDASYDNFVAVPEPGTLLAGLSGLALLGRRARRARA